MLVHLVDEIEIVAADLHKSDCPQDVRAIGTGPFRSPWFLLIL
jgi:hypothetical protein